MCIRILNSNIRIAIIVLSSLILTAGFTLGSSSADTSSEGDDNGAVIGEADDSKKAAVQPFHIGLVTGSDNQGVDYLKGVDSVLAAYGAVEDGGMIRHVLRSDNFFADVESTVELITQLADDPLIKVIYVAEAVPGTVEAFTKIRAKRPDIILLATETHEDMSLISQAADLVVNADFIARGYLIPHSARQLGAKTLVHVSFARHMIDESISRRRAIMEVASQDLGLKFVYANAPDPTGEAGIQGAQDYIRQYVPKWLEMYGPDTAFFTTNNAHTAPMIEQIIKNGGYFVEADEASPLMGYPEALSLDVEEINGDWPRLIEGIEEGIRAAGAGGRLGTWTASLSFCHVAAMVEFGRLVVSGEAEITDLTRLMDCYEKASQGVKWKWSYYVDASLKEVKNVALIYQDTYIFGRGYLGTPSVEVPLKYRAASFADGTAKAPLFHLAVVTGDLTQGAEDVIGAMEMVRRYGEASSGGLIRHVIYTNDYMEDPRKTTALIESLADDPLLKVIVVNQAIEGTSEGFNRVKAKRPDIFCLSGEPHESTTVISEAADLVVAGDFISRGYLLPYAAKSLGADTFVHVSFDRHLSYETIRLRLKIMQQACQELGLKFGMEAAPDPIEKMEEAVAFIDEIYPSWIEKYGRQTAFYLTNDAHTGPLLRQMAKHGGYFIEADIPSPLLGYPRAFDLYLEDYLGQWPTILEMVEKAVEKAGGSGRMGTWTYPLGFIQTTGLVEFGKLLAESKTTISDIDTLLQCLDVFSPGSRWNGSYLNDLASGKPVLNYFLIYQDTYIFGRGYIETTKVEIPDKFYAITLND
jgi:hypothetical protein